MKQISERPEMKTSHHPSGKLGETQANESSPQIVAAGPPMTCVGSPRFRRIDLARAGSRGQSEHFDLTPNGAARQIWRMALQTASGGSGEIGKMQTFIVLDPLELHYCRSASFFLLIHHSKSKKIFD
jgi:hypothetical protein